MKAETLLPLGKLDPGLRAPDTPLNLADVAQESRLADSVGYHTILMEETKDDPFQVLTMAALATERVHVGTSVAIAFARSPYVTAQAAWTAQKISGGRFELGLGSQVRGHMRRRFGLEWHPPGPWMRDYVRAVKAIWHSWQNECDLEFESKHYNLNLNVPLFIPAPIEYPDIPIQIAAVNPYMASVGAEVADGVRLHPVCSPKYIRQVIEPAIADKRPPNVELCLKPLVATGRNLAELEDRTRIARQRLAFYMSTPAYAGAFAIFGLEEKCQEMAMLSKAQRWDELEAAVSDEILNECVIIALYDDLAATIKRRYADVLQRIEVSIPVKTEEDQEVLGDIIRDINA